MEIMNYIKNFVSSISTKISKIYFSKVFLYVRKTVNDNELNIENKNLEKRILIFNIYDSSIINGRLTLSIPNNIIDKIFEIVLVSE